MLEHALRQRNPMNYDAPGVRARVRRVYLLVGIIVVLSVGDLMATLTYLQSTGMHELNPLAAYIIRGQSTLGLILFKGGSVLASVSLLLLMRHRCQGEIAAWIGTCILVTLTVYWSCYTNHVMELKDPTALAETTDETWLSLGEDALP